MSNSFATPWTVARQAPLSMGFPRQESWSGLSFLSSGDLSNTRIELGSSVLLPTVKKKYLATLPNALRTYLEIRVKRADVDFRKDLE